MAEEQRNALVRRSPGAVEKIGTGASNLLSGMVSDALAVARSQTQLGEARFRIGNYEFRDPDYRQILLWAEALKLDPIIVVQRLECACLELDEDQGGTISFRVENGAIISAVWDFGSLPLARFEWVEGLSICEIAFKGSLGAPIERLSLCLPFLHRLLVAGIELRGLDLSGASKLSRLWCHKNQLRDLDLSNVPGLKELACGENQITELDLSNVSELKELDCRDNWLAELDLSNTPKLSKLDCQKNQLNELDLSNVAELKELYFQGNQLAELDLSNVLELRVLSCSANQLAELNLLSVPNLIILYCYENKLTELDLTNVPELIKLYCHENQLTELDLSNVSKLSILWCHQNQLSELDLSNVPELSELDCQKNQLTELDLANVPELNGPDCRDYQLLGHDGFTSWRRFLKYRACDPFVKMRGVRTLNKPELMGRISARNPTLSQQELESIANAILRESTASKQRPAPSQQDIENLLAFLEAECDRLERRS